MLEPVSTSIDDPTDPLRPDDGGTDGARESEPPSGRSLRRSTDDRVLAGVAGGLGRYFSTDPVLFRVLFAVGAFFGGAGVLAYVLCWALVPEEGAVDPPVDRFVDGLRNRGVAFWVVVGVVLVLFWTVLFQSWQPLAFGPVGIAVVIIAVALSKRSTARAAVGGTGEDRGGGAVGYTVTDPTQVFGPTPNVRGSEAEAQIIAARTAARESQRAARRERRQRLAPARWGSFGALVLTLGVLGLLDATRGIPIAAYGWAMLGVGLAALIISGLFRRALWFNLVWVFLGACIIGTFGTTSASALDGTGDVLVAPRSEATLPDEIHQAFGRTTVDLTDLPAGAAGGHELEIRQAAGAIVVNVPEDARVAIHANVHLGAVSVNQPDDVSDGRVDEGREFDAGPEARDVFTIDAELAVGVIEINYVGEESSNGQATEGDAVEPREPVEPSEPVEPIEPP
jgi:phage shock protein PspC (stress-responsive transcriptional regulator)